jgi:hypothetical protein
MPQSLRTSNVHQMDAPTHPSQGYSQPSAGVRVQIDSKVREVHLDRLLTAEDVAERLNVSKDWVWDHSSRRLPHLPVIRMGMAHFDTGPAESKSSSVNGNASLLCGRR